MTSHLVLPRAMGLTDVVEQSARHQAPRHAMALLAERLGATVHEPDSSPGRPSDRLRAVIAPSVELWNLARRIAFHARPGDSVFCSSEAGGLQLAAVLGKRATRPRLCVFVHNVDRPRARAALKWWRMADKVDVFLACSQTQVDFLRVYLGLGDDRVRHIWDHTDTQFFTPGPAPTGRTRPVVVSVGLEQRDYKTLAKATHDLDVDVRISGFSKDADALARTFPETMPDNMSRHFYAWPELAQLYRDADVVIVSCHENKYAAGVQSLMEATASRRPVVVTATEGLRTYLDDSVLAVPPGDVEAMRAAIHATLADPAAAEQRAARGHELALRRYDMDRYVSDIMAAMQAEGPPVA